MLSDSIHGERERAKREEHKGGGKTELVVFVTKYNWMQLERGVACGHYEEFSHFLNKKMISASPQKKDTAEVGEQHHFHSPAKSLIRFYS